MASAALPDSIERYLAAVRRELRACPPPEVDEIERELRSHALDRLGADRSDAAVQAVLASLGDARDIARLNRAVRLETHAPAAPAALDLPKRVGQAVVALLLSLAGYAFAASWLYVAAAKPLFPDRIGLWLLPDAHGDLSLSLGRQALDAGGRELLGWWIVPIGLLLGIVCAVQTYRYDKSLLRRLRAGKARA